MSPHTVARTASPLVQFRSAGKELDNVNRLLNERFTRDYPEITSPMEPIQTTQIINQEQLSTVAPQTHPPPPPQIITTSPEFPSLWSRLTGIVTSAPSKVVEFTKSHPYLTLGAAGLGLTAAGVALSRRYLLNRKAAKPKLLPRRVLPQNHSNIYRTEKTGQLSKFQHLRKKRGNSRVKTTRRRRTV